MWLRSAKLPDSERCKVQNALVDVLAWTSLMNNASMTSCDFFCSREKRVDWLRGLFHVLTVRLLVSRR
jgi:hypothetical protein